MVVQYATPPERANLFTTDMGKIPSTTIDCSGTREMAQRLREPIVIEEDQSLLPSTHIRQLTTACSSNSGGLNALFWFYVHLDTRDNTHACTLVCIYMHTCSHTQRE